jgi:RNA polymerase sigma-70 factor (ECF subfamily)
LQGAVSVGQTQHQRPVEEQSGSRDDDAVMAAIQSRDDAALAVFYDRHSRLAFGLAYRLLGERGAAEDVVQEAFLNVWRRAESYQVGRGSARSWLMSIVHNLAIDRRRGRMGRTANDVAIEDVEPFMESTDEDAFDIVARSMEAAQVQKVLFELPEEQRQAIIMAYFGGLTHQEIAERTGTPLGTIKSRMRLGLRRMRTLIEESIPGTIAIANDGG